MFVIRKYLIRFKRHIILMQIKQLFFNRRYTFIYFFYPFQMDKFIFEYKVIQDTYNSTIGKRDVNAFNATL